MSRGDLLFHKYDLLATLENNLSKTRAAVRTLPADTFENESDDATLDRLTQEHSLTPVELRENDISVDVEEAQVDVSRDPMRNLFGDRGPIYVPGQRVRYVVPFAGDGGLFQCRPSTFTLNPPRAIVQGSELIFEYTVPLEDVPKTKKAFEDELANVKQYLSSANSQIENHNAQIRSVIVSALQQRREQLRAGKQNIDALGYPMRPRVPQIRASTSTSEAQPARTEPARKAVKQVSPEYDVALSFAGEDRDYVEQVAEILKTSGVKVFYDKFETAQLWGRNLADHLGEVYGKRSRFVVIFISKYYPLKAWPKHERQSAQARAIRENKIVLLPARFDDAEIEGMPSSTAYVDLRRTTPAELAKLVQQKLSE
jgi:TIR domain